MIIIKTLGQDTFSWNPNAFNKKGHWFLLAETGSYIRAATKQESNKLGKPKKQDENQIDVKTGEKKMSYQRAAEIRKKSLRNLITDKLVEGEGIGSSIGGSISEKMKAKATGFKEKMDPMNIAKMLTGKLGSALLGKITGRSKEDISYFAGDKKHKESKAKTSNVNTAINKSDTALYSAISDGNNQSMKKGDGIATVLARMYNLIKMQQIQSIKRFQIEKNFKKIKEKQKDKWNKELIDALKNRKTATIITEGKKEEGGGLLDMIKGLIEGAKSFLMGIINGVVSWIWGHVGGALTLLEGVAGLLGFKSLLQKLSGMFGDKPKVTPEGGAPKGKGVKAEESKATEKEIQKEGDKKLKEESKGKEAKETVERGKEAQKKEKEKVQSKEGKTATKVTEQTKPKATKVTSSSMKAAGKILKFFKSVPFLGLVAGAPEMIQKVQEAMAKRESGEMNDEELKKVVVGEVGALLGGAGGAQVGALIGGAVGGPIGALIAGGAGFFAGSKLGHTAAEMLFDKATNSELKVTEEPKTAEQVTPTTTTSKKSIPTGDVGPVVKKAEVPAKTTTQQETTKQKPVAPKITPVPTPNPTDNRLQSTMDKNMEIKSASESSVNTTVIDNSQSIGASGGGSGGVVVESSVGVRTDESTLQRIQRQNARSM